MYWTTMMCLSYFDPRLPRGRRPHFDQLGIRHDAISIHASLAGGDGALRPFVHAAVISIHASLAGGDHALIVRRLYSVDFNPRLPRGRRLVIHGKENYHDDFNPRLPRGRRLPCNHVTIGIFKFQSTPPSREATARHSLILPLEHNIWEFLRICREGCCFSLTFVAEKRRISTCYGANRPGKWAQLQLRTTGNFAYDLLLGR